VRLRGWSLTARQAAWEQITGAPAIRASTSAKVAGAACANELVHEGTAEPGEASVLGGAVGIRVPPVPGQPGHAHAELPERLRGPGLVAERLDPFEGEHQPDPVAPSDVVEVRRGADLDEPVGRLANGPEEAGGLPEGLAQRPLRLTIQVDEDGAHLKAHIPGFEQRQPGAGERLALAEVELAVAELEEEVEVGVGDHDQSLRA